MLRRARGNKQRLDHWQACQDGHGDSSCIAQHACRMAFSSRARMVARCRTVTCLCARVVNTAQWQHLVACAYTYALARAPLQQSVRAHHVNKRAGLHLCAHNAMLLPRTPDATLAPLTSFARIVLCTQPSYLSRRTRDGGGNVTSWAQYNSATRGK